MSMLNHICIQVLLTLLGSAIIVLSGCADERRNALDRLPEGAPIGIEQRPRVSVGVSAGDSLHELYRAVTPFLLPDGHLVVPLAGMDEIRVFDRDGRFLKRLGRSGEGPGEFSSLSAAWSRGDTIEAFDSRLRRVTRFGPDSSVQIVPLERDGWSDLSAGGGPVQGGWVFGGVASAGYGQRDSVVFRYFDNEGRHQGEVAWVPGMARYVAAGFGGPEPLSPRPLFATDGRSAYIAETETPSIRIHQPPGTFLREISWDPERSQSPREARRLVMDSVIARSAPEQVGAIREWLEAAPAREHLSVFWDFVVDAEGFIWIQPYEPSVHAFALGATALDTTAGRGEWLILFPGGSKIGSLELPAGLELTQVTSDAVVGIRRDELGVESVHVYALSRHGVR